MPRPWPASSALPPLTRCCAAEIAEVLLALLAGEAFLADMPWSEIGWGSMRLDLANGWQLQIAIDRDHLGALQWALAPDGRNWEIGCERDDWTLGPDSQTVEPVGLLSRDQRQQLERMLRQAHCWPPPELQPGLVFPDDWLKPSERDDRSRSSCRPLRRGSGPGRRVRSRGGFGTDPFRI